MLKYIYKLLKRHKNVSVVASTGMAAKILDLGATTFHSFCGLLDGRYSSDQIIHRLNTDPSMQHVKKRILEVEVLMIDEISMLSAAIFTIGEEVIRKIRKSDHYFGAVQVQIQFLT